MIANVAQDFTRAVGATAGGGFDAISAVARQVLSPRGLVGAGTEVAWQLLHLALYPFGLAKDQLRADPGLLRLDDLSPEQRGLTVGDVEAAGTPIVLLHGVADNRSIFALLRRGLRRRGFGRVIAYNYSPWSQDIRAVAAELDAAVERVCDETGFERIHLIGHSMGGLVARYYVQRLGGDARVHTLVTLGSPHHGSNVARLIPLPLARQLRPNSDLITELEEPAPGCRTRFVAVYSDLDQMILPAAAAALDHPDLKVRNVLIRGVGHQSLPVDGRVVREICTSLAQLDHDGSQAVAGVTSLTAELLEKEVRPRRRGKA